VRLAPAGGDDGEHAARDQYRYEHGAVSIWWKGEDFKLMEARARTSAGDVSAKLE